MKKLRNVKNSLEAERVTRILWEEGEEQREGGEKGALDDVGPPALENTTPTTCRHLSQ